jgi:hypothetical protein
VSDETLSAVGTANFDFMHELFENAMSLMDKSDPNEFMFGFGNIGSASAFARDNEEDGRAVGLDRRDTGPHGLAGSRSDVSQPRDGSFLA